MISTEDNSLRRPALVLTIVILLGTAFLPEISVGQEAAQESTAKDRYEKALERTRDLAKVCRNISVRFFDSSLAESHQWKEKWPQASKDLADQRYVLEKAAIDWFMECQNPPLPLIELVSGASNELYEAGNMELSFQILKKVNQFNPPENIIFDRRLALAGIKANHFEYALEFIQNPKAKEAVEKLEKQMDKNMFIVCPLLAKNWEQELEIRKKEAESDDLPRVRFQLSTGEVVVELFENEAPQTVANFINLVESGFYDDSVCHPVIESIVAQAGLYHRTQHTRLDYVIKNESKLPESRNHFVGSLSMVSATNNTDSATAAFVFTLLPNPDLDWNRTADDDISQTVFGRVVTGMEFIAA